MNDKAPERMQCWLHNGCDHDTPDGDMTECVLYLGETIRALRAERDAAAGRAELFQREANELRRKQEAELDDWRLLRGENDSLRTRVAELEAAGEKVVRSRK